MGWVHCEKRQASRGPGPLGNTPSPLTRIHDYREAEASFFSCLKINAPASAHHGNNAASWKSIVIFLLEVNKIGSEKMMVMLSVRLPPGRWKMERWALENLKYLCVPFYLSLCITDTKLLRISGSESEKGAKTREKLTWTGDKNS